MWRSSPSTTCFPRFTSLTTWFTFRRSNHSFVHRRQGQNRPACSSEMNLLDSVLLRSLWWRARMSIKLVVKVRSLRRAAELVILTSPFFAWLQISFILAFVITAISLLANRTLGRVGALIGLSIVLLNYVVWCAFSSRSLQVIGRDSFYQEYPEYMPQFIPGLVGLIGGISRPSS